MRRVSSSPLLCPHRVRTMSTGPVQFDQREPLGQLVQNLVEQPVLVHRHFVGFGPENLLEVNAVRRDPRAVQLRRQRVDHHVVVRRQRAGAENDTADVALASGPQAHDEPRVAVADAALVGVRDDRRVEQRRRIDGVFHRQVRPGQEPPAGGPQAVPADHRRAAFVVLVERECDAGVPVGVRRLDAAEQLFDVVFGDRRKAFEQGADAARAEHERPGDHPAVVTGQMNRKSSHGGLNPSSLRSVAGSVVQTIAVYNPRAENAPRRRDGVRRVRRPKFRAAFLRRMSPVRPSVPGRPAEPKPRVWPARFRESRRPGGRGV